MLRYYDRCKGALLFLPVLVSISRAAITGCVIDGSNKAVADAMICYTGFANRLIYVYTNADGLFSLPGPSEWSIDSLPMYRPVQPTRIHQASFSRASGSALQAYVARGMVFFTLCKANRRTTADVYDIFGKLITRVFDKNLGAGTHVFCPFTKGEHGWSRRMYVVRLSDGTVSVVLKMINTGRYALSGIVETGTVTSLESSPEIARMAAVDAIRAGKTGYAGKTVSVNTYNDAVGDVQITTVDIEAKVDSLLGLMTTNEKIGQTTQTRNYDAAFITGNFIGSCLKKETWSAVSGAQEAALATRLKIPLFNENDHIHGGPTIYFPHNAGMGASNDTALMELAYRCYSMMSKGIGNHVNFAPCVDVPRDDHHGRVYEGWSEVTDDACVRARAAVRGVQGTDLTSDWTMVATVKHFAGAGGTDGGHVNPADCNTGTEAVLAKIHLPQMLAAVKAGVGSVMTAYNAWRGTSMVEHKRLITDTLKNAWKFDGYVISDWCTMVSNGSLNINAVNAGEDMAMVPDEGNYNAYLNGMKTNVDGSIPMARLDDMVKRILRIKFRANLFLNPMPRQDLSTSTNDDLYRTVARVCVAKSLVLLKNNNNALPLKKNATIYVVGSWEDNIGLQCGGWSATDASLVDDPWQGSTTAHFLPGTSVLQALQNAVAGNGGTVTFTEKSVEAAKANAADIIVCCVGETPYAEQPGVWSDITIDAAGNPNMGYNQQNLVQTCKGYGKPVVTVIIAGRPIPLGTIPGNSDAIVMAWLPGTEGQGMADVLFGDRDFTGKLRFTWPASDSQEPINTGNMGDKTGSGGNPLFAYGTGLTY